MKRILSIDGGGLKGVFPASFLAEVERYSATVSNGRFKMDSIKDIEALRGLGYSEARKALPQLHKWLTETAEPFEPYRKLQDPETNKVAR